LRFEIQEQTPLHELSIAMEVLDIVRREVSSHGASIVTKVRLRIGDLSGVEIEPLTFSFDAVKCEQPLTATAELVIEKIPVRVHCITCDDEFQAAGHAITCPACGGYETRLLAGEELEIVDFEVE
jgi:hydrogenase nickel incorporation protein HypA/HybF